MFLRKEEGAQEAYIEGCEGYEMSQLGIQKSISNYIMVGLTPNKAILSAMPINFAMIQTYHKMVNFERYSLCLYLYYGLIGKFQIPADSVPLAIANYVF